MRHVLILHFSVVHVRFIRLGRGRQEMGGKRFYQRKDVIDAVTPDKRGEIASVRLGGSEDAHRLFLGGALMPPVEMTSCILYLALVVFGIPKDHFLSFHFPSVNITAHALTIIGCFKRSWHSFTVYIHYYVCMLVTKTLIYICN